MLRKRRNNLAEVVSTLVQQSEEEEAKVGVAAFLCKFFLHSGDGGLEEEGDEEFVGTFGTDLAEGIEDLIA